MRERLPIVDALRALALAGILQVNIQSFAWGAGDPLGFFAEPPDALDSALHLLVGTFVSTKFLSIFAFLFGLGFALQWRSLRRRLAAEAAREVYRRRLWFLLALGLAHGVLLYFGDILAAYALAGFLLLRYATVRPAALVAAARAWWFGFAALTLASTVAFELLRLALPVQDDAARLPAWALERLAVYTQGGFVQQIAPRAADYLSILGTMALLAVPQIVGLFLLGAIAGRLGWLSRPQRHQRLWRVASWLGAAALPFAAAGAWLNFVTIRDSPGDPSGIGYALQAVGSAVACLYVALLVRLRQRSPMQSVIAWLAPAGRMPLTNYVGQSVAMGLLLSGWGLGLGASLGRAELALLAVAIVVVQIVFSRAWIGRFGQGPLEAAWHRATYGARP
ncbi:MAG: DUF418 domain-containing protein [Burkholderiales bacterium]|jgi:uncharacterized protein|nr:DUF418 domain-containing protein [Burkholderiales bacterium]